MAQGLCLFGYNMSSLGQIYWAGHWGPLKHMTSARALALGILSLQLNISKIIWMCRSLPGLCWCAQ